MFAVTERLLLRPGWPEDATALVAAIGDDAVGRQPACVSPDDCMTAMGSVPASPSNSRRPHFLIVRRADAALVGSIGLRGEGAPELRCWIAAPHRGRGLATEAGRAVVALAEASLRLPRLLAFHQDDDPAVARLLARLGFSRRGGSAGLFAREARPDHSLAA